MTNLSFVDLRVLLFMINMILIASMKTRPKDALVSLYCVALCCVVLRCVVLGCAELCCAVLCCFVLCCIET